MFNNINYKATSIVTKLNYIYHLGIFGNTEFNYLIENSLIDLLFNSIYRLGNNAKFHFNELTENCKSHNEKSMLFKAAQILHMKRNLESRYNDTKSKYFPEKYVMEENMYKIAHYTNECDIQIAANLYEKLIAEIHLFECWKNGKAIGNTNYIYQKEPEKYLKLQLSYMQDLKCALQMKKLLIEEATKFEKTDNSNDSDSTLTQELNMHMNL